MADSLFQDHSFPLPPKPTSRNNRGTFFSSNFLFTLLLIPLFLSITPLLTSKAPSFISHTAFSKSWDLFHLLIIGIAVSYGLFGRRRTQTQTGLRTSPAFNSPDIFHASTVFNFEHQNPSAYGVNQGFEFSPYGAEPTAVMRPCTHDFDYQPLDLPVRSLRSRVEETESEEFAGESEKNCYPCSPYVDKTEAKQACCENVEPCLPAQSPLCSWSGPTVEENVDNKLLTPPMLSLKSRSMRVALEEKVGAVSVHVDDTLCQNLPHSQVLSSGFSPLCSVASISPTTETQNLRRDSKLQHLESCSFRSTMGKIKLPCAVSEKSPLTVEMGNLQTETKKTIEDHSFSPFNRDSDISSNLVGSRSQRSIERDGLKGEKKTRIGSLRFESSSCDTTSSAASHHFSSAVEPKRLPEIVPCKEEASRTQLGSSSSLNKDERKALSRTRHSGRFSIGCLFDRDKSKEVTNKVKAKNGNSHNKCGWGCLKLDVKPILRGKSVRTARPQAITLEPSCTANEVSRKLKADESLREGRDVVIISIGISEKSNGGNEKGSTSRKNERGESSCLELEKRSSSVVEKDCNSEIDRKAGVYNQLQRADESAKSCF